VVAPAIKMRVHREQERRFQIQSVLVAWWRVVLDELNYDHHRVGTVAAMELVCIVYCADYLHVPGATLDSALLVKCAYS
jgi:hypothetical protein